MCNVPLKFYQVCRLCLTLVNDCDVKRLKVLDSTELFNKSHKYKNEDQISTDDLQNLHRQASSTSRTCHKGLYKSRKNSISERILDEEPNADNCKVGDFGLNKITSKLKTSPHEQDVSFLINVPNSVARYQSVPKECKEEKIKKQWNIFDDREAEINEERFRVRKEPHPEKSNRYECDDSSEAVTNQIFSCLSIKVS